MDLEIIEEYLLTDDEERREYLLAIILVFFMDLYEEAKNRFAEKYEIDITEYSDTIRYEYYNYLYDLLVEAREKAREKKRELDQEEQFERDRGTWIEPVFDPFEHFEMIYWATIESSESDRSQQIAQYGVVVELQRQHPEYTIEKFWLAFPGCCEICAELAKRPPIPLNEPFLHYGSTVTLPGGKVFIYKYINSEVASAHPNDRCRVEYIIRR